MKKAFLSLSFIILISTGIHAKIHTVSNDTNRPAEYKTIQAAHDIAVEGDTILVYGSALNYSQVLISKALVIIGAGYNKAVGEQTVVSNLTYNLSNPFEIRSLATGFQVGSIYFNSVSGSNIENIVIENMKINGTINFNNSGSVSSITRNDTIRNCIIQNSEVYLRYGTTYENLQIHNCIFDNSTIRSESSTLLNLQNVFVKNNIFINQTTNTFVSTKALILNNNIFYKSEPQGCTNCVFNNNITFSNTDNTIPGVNNFGSGNILATNPQFTLYPISGGAFSYAYDFHLKSTSPGKNTGTDGTDIGIYGGILPFEVGANPSIPVMTEISIPQNQSSAKPGGTIPVTFKATNQ